MWEGQCDGALEKLQAVPWGTAWGRRGRILKGLECQTQALGCCPKGTREPWKSLEQGSGVIRICGLERSLWLSSWRVS